jgi:adenylylsulfate kinase
MDNKSENIQWSVSSFSRPEREKLIGQKGCVIWLTGLSGSGKSTIAKELERRLVEKKVMAYVLDGDNIRHGLSSDLGFSDADRAENIRRIGAAAELFADAGIMAITAFISPFEKGRELARQSVGEDRFFDIFLDAPLSVCEERDPKGLYKKVRSGEISNFTGIDSPYEKPVHPTLVLNTADLTVDESVEKILSILKENDIIG